MSAQNREVQTTRANELAERAHVLSDTAKTLDEHKQAAYEHNAAFIAFRDLASAELSPSLKQLFEVCMRAHNRKSHEHAIYVSQATDRALSVR